MNLRPMANQGVRRSRVHDHELALLAQRRPGEHRAEKDDGVLPGQEPEQGDQRAHDDGVGEGGESVCEHVIADADGGVRLLGAGGCLCLDARTKELIQPARPLIRFPGLAFTVLLRPVTNGFVKRLYR